MSRNERRFRSAERRLWASVGVDPDERRVRLRTGETLRVQETGAGEPVILVHGASNGGTSWAPLMARLPDVRCIALDRPGCGLSEPVAGGAGLDDIGALEEFADSFIVDVLDALDLASAHIVATSFGGYFAFRAAAAHPERIRSIVEFSWPMGARMAKVPIAMRISGVPGVGRAMAKVPPTRAAVRMLLRQIGLRHALDSGRFTDEMFEWYLSLLRDTDSLRNEQRASPQVITPIRGQNTRMVLSPALLARVSAPVRFIWGADDPNGGEDVARSFAAFFPNSELDVLPDAGHAPWIDDPDTCAELTASFLKG